MCMQMITRHHWGRLPHCAGASGGALGLGCWKLCYTLVPREAAEGAEEIPGGGRGRSGYDTGWGSLQLCRGRAPGGVREIDQEFHEALEVGVTTLPSLGSL